MDIRLGNQCRQVDSTTASTNNAGQSTTTRSPDATGSHETVRSVDGDEPRLPVQVSDVEAILTNADGDAAGVFTFEPGETAGIRVEARDDSGDVSDGTQAAAVVVPDGPSTPTKPRTTT